MALKPPKRRQSVSKGAQHNGATTINIGLIPITIVVGILAWIIGNFFYSKLVDTIPRSMLIGIVFVLLYIMLAMVIFGFSNATSAFEENILTGGSSQGIVIAILLIAAVFIFAVATLFQWIYGLNFKQENLEPSSYIFVIDDSGSMKENDQNQERYAAIPEVLNGKGSDFPYMIYSFSDNVKLVRDMSPASKGIPPINGNSHGSTAMKAALIQVIDDYETGKWDGGSTPKVVLLTDGYATDIGFLNPINKVLKRYTAAHVSVSTVGLGHVDKSLMNKIAKTTGGVFIDVSDASDLSKAMTSAATQYTDRDLLSTRYTTKFSVLYGVIRILFITILGTAIGLLMAVAYGSQDSTSLTGISSFIKTLVGAILMEIGTSVVGVSDRFTWLVLWILIALTLTNKIVTRKRENNRSMRRSIPNPNKSSRDLSKF